MDSENQSAATYLMVTEFAVYPSKAQDLMGLWKRASLRLTKGRQLYFSDEKQTLVELAALSDLDLSIVSFFANLDNEFTQDAIALMSSDWHRQIVHLAREVKPQASILPNTSYIQLRYIEVPLSVYGDYLSWREKTIFPHVKSHGAIKSFSAYHTTISTQPGVLFISGFDGDISAYNTCFEEPAYKEIIRQAGSKYISGGERCLYTHTVKKVGELL